MFGKFGTFLSISLVLILASFMLAIPRLVAKMLLVQSQELPRNYTGPARNNLSLQFCVKNLDFTHKISKWSKNTFKRNNSKYLLAIPFGGPSNQIIGIKSGIQLSKLLNRTIVEPLFYHHSTDKFQKYSFVPWQIRMGPMFSEDHNYLQLRDFKNVCNNDFDVGFS